MKRLLAIGLLCAFSCGLYAQAVDTTVCAVLKNPKSFDGKIVRIKGTVAAGLDQFVVKAGDCGLPVNEIWLSYPQGTKGKAGPVALLQIQPAHNFSGTFTPVVRTPVTLEKSKDFKQFDSLLSQAHNKGGMCLACNRNEVNATLVGRLDGVADASLRRDTAGKIVGFGGFGNMNAYPARLVLQSVSEVTPKEVDYSASDAATKGDSTPLPANSSPYDPLADAQKSVAGLGGSPAGIMAQKDIAAFGKSNEHNGVSIAFSVANEASAKDDALGAHDSPDGVLFNCTFNMNRLEGDALARALVHVGQHVVDARTPVQGNEDAPLYLNEYNAWVVTATAVVGNGQKFLTLPGGYLLWNVTWPLEDRITKMNDALSNFLSKEELLSK
jgi:hypothetical protein